MSLDASTIYNGAKEGVKRINKGITKGVYDDFKTMNRICVLTSDGVMHMVKDNFTTCEQCWEHMKNKGFISVEVNDAKGEKEHLIHAGLIREMFLGTKPLR